MIDLIDRSEVLYKFAEILPEADSLDWYKQAKPEEVKDLVDEMYSIVLSVNRINAQPVKHGQWSECWRDPGRNVISVICSACNDASLAYLPKRDLAVDDVPKKICIQMPYCPKCSAKMGGESDGR